MIMNEKIKASEVLLTGIGGEDLGIVPIGQALAQAKKLKVDLVCTSLLSSPPPCRLIGRGAARQEAQQEKREDRKRLQPLKIKEIRLTVNIEDHDYETKRKQAEKILSTGDAVQLVVRIQGKEGPLANELLGRLLKELAPYGQKKTGLQLSGKQATVQVNPRSLSDESN